MPPVHYSTQIPHLGVDNSWNGYSQAYAYSGSQVLTSEDQGYMHPEQEVSGCQKTPAGGQSCCMPIQIQSRQGGEVVYFEVGRFKSKFLEIIATMSKCL